MRILIIEDEIITGRFIEQQLKANFDCETILAVNQTEVHALMPGFRPQLLLCDINLNEENDGITLVKNLRHDYDFEVIFITSYQSRTIIENALETKPLNYLIKPVDEAAIFTALRLAWPAIVNNPLLGNKKDATTSSCLLSPIEQKIVQLILDKQTSQEIAEHLFISPYTVKNHRHRICRKLGLKEGNNALLKWAMYNFKKQ